MPKSKTRRRKGPPKVAARARTGVPRQAITALARDAASLLAEGRFEEALKKYLNVAAADPMHHSAHASIAALLTRSGNEDQGRNVLRKYFERRPLGPAPKGNLPPRPLVLKLRGFDGTRITIGARRNGQYKRKFRGGHFTTGQLLLKPDFAMQTLTISGDNLLREGAVPEHDLMLNTIAEPDIEGASLASLARYLEQHPETPIINRPEGVLHTTRDGNYRRLRDFDGAIFPRTERLTFHGAGPDEVSAELDRLGVECPFIIRQVGTQTGRTVSLIEKPEQVAGYAAKGLDGDYYVIAYRQILWQGEFFRKLRLFHIDGAFYPVVCHLDLTWNVHGGNRKEIMRTREDLMAEEKRFLADWPNYIGTANVGHLEKIAEMTGLDFFGIDFTVDDDGRIFIYELNAAMRHSFDHAENFPYKMPYDQATSDAFARMVRARLPGSD